MLGQRRAPGFTLFEVLGVILVTTLLLGVALNFYVDLPRQAARASDNTREVRRATAILDRVAGDLEHALLLRKPAEADPLAHPWLFLAESSTLSAEGADRLKFVRRLAPRSSDGPVSDVGLVVYTLVPGEDDENFELRRWTSAGLPEGLDRDFPYPDDPGSLLLTDGVAYFAARFLDDSGEWRPAWDSSQLVDSSELPWAVEIEIALADPAWSDDPERELEEPHRYLRRVQLPLRPIDLEALLEVEEEDQLALQDGEEEQGEAGLTLEDCVDFAVLASTDQQSFPLTVSDMHALRAQAPTTPFAPYATLLAGHPAVKPHCFE